MADGDQEVDSGEVAGRSWIRRRLSKLVVRVDLDEHMTEVLEGASVALVLKVTGAALAFALNILLGRILGARGAGLYFLALSVVTVATVFGRRGLDNTLLRFVAANASVEDWVAVNGVYRIGIGMSAAAAGLATVAVVVVAPWLAVDVFSKPELATPLRWMALSVVPFSLLSLHSQALKGLKRILYAQVVEGVGVPALCLPGLYVLGRAWGVKGAAWAYLIATLATMALGMLLWRRATPWLRDLPARFDRATLVASSRPLFLVASINLLMMWTSTFVLGVWGTKADVGIYNAASRTATLITFLLVAVNSIAAPKFAALYRKGDMEALGSTYRRSARLITVLATPALGACVLFPRQIMGLFGPEFVAGGLVLVILAVGQYVNVATGSIRYLLMMCGHERTVRNIVAGASVVNVGLNLTLVPMYGVTGAAIATGFSLATLNVALVVVVPKLLDIRVIGWS